MIPPLPKGVKYHDPRHVPRCSQAMVVLVGILVVALPFLQAQRQPTHFAVEARWISGYKSLCEVEPKRSPKAATIPPGGGWTIAGCSDLNKRPVAPLSMTVTNTDSATSRQFTIPLLSEIAIRTGGASATAVAFYVPWGSRTGFATDLQGHLVIDVAPQASVELIYLLPKGGADATVVLKDYGAVTLRRD
jgi:hypothetical protein